MDTPPDILDIENQLDAAERDALELAAGLGEERGGWRPNTGSWSVAECLDHLATANRVYLPPMRQAALRAQERGSRRSGPAVPGIVGGWFVRSLEPPVGIYRLKAPRSIRPRTAPPLADALSSFVASQQDVRAFLCQNANLDLAHIRFVNPFIRGVRFSLATGLHVITAHQRRHLWQARRVREASAAGI